VKLFAVLSHKNAINLDWRSVFVSNFCVFFKKTTLYGNYGKLFKILFRKFFPPHRSTLLHSNVVKFVRREIGETVRYSHDWKKTKFRLPFKLSLLRGSRPKSARASLQHLLGQFWPWSISNICPKAFGRIIMIHYGITQLISNNNWHKEIRRYTGNWKSLYNTNW